MQNSDFWAGPVILGLMALLVYGLFSYNNPKVEQLTTGSTHVLSAPAGK